MLVHLGVFLTFDSAIRAGLGASLEHALDQCLVAAGATRGEAGRGQADRSEEHTSELQSH